MTTMVTKERAQELLAAATPGPWEAGAVRVYATAGCPRHAPNADALRGTHCRCRTVTMDAADADRALIAATPDLAATVVAQADELARLRAIVGLADRSDRASTPLSPMEQLEASLTLARNALDRTERERDALRAELARRDEVERAARADADAVMAHFMAPGEGDTALAEALDPVDALNAAVTAAILRAERLAREGADATAAYADVARYEAALAALHPADTVEGETAREGVRLAVIGCAPVGGSEESGWMLGCDVGGMRVGDPPGQWGGAGRPRPEAVTAFGRCVRAVGRARKGAAVRVAEGSTGR